MLQSKAGIVNKEYQAQKAILADVDAGKVPVSELLTRGDELAAGTAWEIWWLLRLDQDE